MEVNRRGFPELITDNEENFLRHLTGVIEASDELSCMEITKTPLCYKFRIAPSVPMYIDPIIRELTKFSNQFGIRLDMGKSIRTTATITFDITTNGNF